VRRTVPESHLSCVLDREIVRRWREHRVTRSQYRANPANVPVMLRYFNERVILFTLFEVRARGKGRHE
jgi:hypothetical protein